MEFIFTNELALIVCKYSCLFELYYQQSLTKNINCLFVHSDKTIFIGERNTFSAFKPIQDLIASSKVKGKLQFSMLIEKSSQEQKHGNSQVQLSM